MTAPVVTPCGDVERALAEWCEKFGKDKAVVIGAYRGFLAECPHEEAAIAYVMWAFAGEP